MEPLTYSFCPRRHQNDSGRHDAFYKRRESDRDTRSAYIETASRMDTLLVGIGLAVILSRFVSRQASLRNIASLSIVSLCGILFHLAGVKVED